MTAYYNEFDPFAAEWLRNLIAAGLIAPGEVDTRSIKDVQPSDLEGFTQHHFFAGVGGWSLALRLAGWRKGVDDARHLWPDFFRLIAKCRPDVVFGEQVPSAIGHGWLDGISADLEGEGYAVGAIVLGAHSVGAPHVRQRLWWVADAGSQPGGRNSRRLSQEETRVGSARLKHGDCVERSSNGGDDGLRLAESAGGGFDGRAGTAGKNRAETGDDCELGIPNSAREGSLTGVSAEQFAECCGSVVHCKDGKQRRIEPGSFPLAHGIPAKLGPSLAGVRELVRGARRNRVGRLKGYGNAIVPEVAAEFIRAFMECCA